MKLSSLKQKWHFEYFIRIFLFQNLPGDIGLMVVFPSLLADHAGNYTCVAKYANSVDLKATVTVETYGKGLFSSIHYLRHFSAFFNNNFVEID